MEVELKQRLVGASVIIALAIIFIPMIFENTQVSENQSITIEIPDEPKGLKHKILNIDTSQVTADPKHEVLTSNNKIPQGILDINDESIKPVIKKQEKIIDLVDNSVQNNTIPKDKVDVEEKNIQPETSETKLKTTPKTTDNKQTKNIPKTNKDSQVVQTDNTYRVKFGVFSQEKNAQQLKAKIINAGFTAIVEEIVEKDKLKQTYKVFSNQFTLKSGAEKLSNSIQRLKLNIGKPVIETLTEEDRLASEILLDTGWIIQIGIFSSQVNSLKLRDKIRNKAFVSFVDEIKNSKNETRYRVRIGPYATRDEAVVELKNIKIKMNLPGLIKPHEKQKVI